MRAMARIVHMYRSCNAHRFIPAAIVTDDRLPLETNVAFVIPRHGPVSVCS